MSTYVRPILLLAFSLFVSCTSNNPQSSNFDPVDSVISQKIERVAVEMALFYSGEYRPPTDLTNEIRADLLRLYRTFGINPTFYPSWSRHSLSMYFDSLTEQSILRGENREWDRLITKYEFTVTTFRPLVTTFFYLTPREILHPERLAERVEDEHLHGLISLWISGMYYPIPGNIARAQTRSSTKYFVMDVTCPDLWQSYRYIELQGFRVIDHGYFDECAPDTLEIWNLPWSRAQEILDSIEASRPAWVDTARVELRRLEMPLAYHFGQR